MTLFEKLQAAGLPVVFVDELTGIITMGAMTDEQIITYNRILLEHYQSGEYQTLLENEADIQNIKDNFQSRWDTLTLIENKQTFTATEAAQVLNFLASTQKRIMKWIYRQL